jgi:subtilisin family serine protease
MTRFLQRVLLSAAFLTSSAVTWAAPATYQVHFKGATVADVNERTPGNAEAKARAGRERLAGIRDEHAAMKARWTSMGLEVIGATEVLENSILVVAEESAVAGLRAEPGVVSVEKIVPMERHTATSVPFIGAPAAWSAAVPGLTGKGIRIGIVDSGIDYTHATFGGSGNPATYAANNPALVVNRDFPTTKVVGGRDFAGDNYDASGVDGSLSPVADDDPLDPQANGHGSHVAAIAAGHGVLTGGATFAGPYGTNVHTNTFLVGPGVAPEASLFALKVFGRRGTTTLVPLALNWAADPNGNGDTSDRLDVVNLSLGSGFGTDAADGQINAINRLASLGCVVVISAGNAGNTHFILGSPGTAARAITVANTFDDGSTSSTITVTAPVEVVGDYAAVEGVFTRPIAVAGRISAQVVEALPLDACQDGDNGLITNGAALAGKIALINRGTCFFVNKVRAAQQAGAVGVIMVNNVDGFPFPMGGTGDTSDIRIPGVMISRTDGGILRRRVADGLTVVFEPRGATVRPELADQLADSSSRGPVAYTARLKPDIAAPGSSIPSARAGFGTEAILQTGTSMSAPHVAGAAAILKQLRPTWTPSEIKAALMNSAARTANSDGIAYAESRSGAGRVNLAAAVATTIIARDDEVPDEVSLSFGHIEVLEPTNLVRRVRITNKGTGTATLAVVVSNTLGGRVATLVPSTNTVKLSPGQEKVVSFTLTVRPVPVEDDTTTPDVQGERLRPKMPEASGQIWFRSSSVSLHVPWHSVVRPVAVSRAGALAIGLPGDPARAIPVPTAGSGTNLAALVGVFQLGATSSQRNVPFPGSAGDLLATGAASDFAATGDLDRSRVFLALAAGGRWITPQPAFYSLGFDIDRDLDGIVDFRVVNSTGGNINGNDLTDDRLANDFLVSAVVPSAGGDPIEGGVLNVLDPRQHDTAVFQNAVLVHSFPATAIGLDAASSAFRYRAVLTAEGGSETGPWSDFDATAPQVDATGHGIGNSPWQREGRTVRTLVGRRSGSSSALLLHLHNPVGQQVEVVRFDASTSDVDGNGLADALELLHFPGLGNVGSADPDGDGVSTALELAAGTDPLNADAGFLAGPVRRGFNGSVEGTPVLTWQGAAGRRYGVLRAVGPGGPFSSIATGIEASGGVVSFTDPQPPAAAAFYRIVQE